MVLPDAPPCVPAARTACAAAAAAGHESNGGKDGDGRGEGDGDGDGDGDGEEDDEEKEEEWCVVGDADAADAVRQEEEGLTNSPVVVRSCRC